jgi:uncharacterized protein (TIRG00374 family)
MRPLASLRLRAVAPRLCDEVGFASTVNAETGTNGIEVATDQSSSRETQKATFGGKQWIATILTLLVVVFVFAVVFPSLGDYSEAWTAIQGMSIGWIIALAVSTVVVIAIYPWPSQMALPGLKYRPAFVIRQTSFMIGNVIPEGGAIGLGMQYDMLGSYGYASAPSAAAIGISGVSNTLVTLALPVLSLVGLMLVGEATSEDYVIALIGIVVIAIALVVIGYILRSESSARRVGDWANGAFEWIAGLFHKKENPHLGDSLVSVRSSAIGAISGRGMIVAGADALQQISQFVVLFVAILALQGGLGGEVNLAEAFAAFAIARLAQFIPIPPGGLGTTDAILIGILTGFGMSSSDAMAADLIWRAATYFPQVLIGIGTLLVWRRRQRTTAKLATQG